MSTPGNAVKLVATHNNIQTAQSGPSLVGIEPRTYNALVSTPVSHQSNSLCQPGVVASLHFLKSQIYPLQKTEYCNTLHYRR